ncbi:MAG: N-acetyltransferase family protein [Parvibaculum sedimenti]|uniref:GNAT family N-acetyltransferase n=1 Tax=Parvibaculum sedimenti TaxID=2608632 RepID=UPI003BB6C85F
MTYIVRPATSDDLPGILLIHNDAVRNTAAIWMDEEADLADRAAWLADHFDHGFPVLVAVQGHAVLGFSAYGHYRPRSGYRHTVENSIYIHPDARGRGLGFALMKPLVAHARADGHHVMMACIEAQNTASIALHERLGFREVGRMPEVGRKFGRWLDLVLMQLMLEA